MKKILALSLAVLILCFCIVKKDTERPKAGEITSVVNRTDSGVLLDVPFCDQREYPTGCELVSTTMVLAYYGFQTTPAELINDGHIKTSSVYYRNNVKYGSDPNKVFIGSPYDPGSYGCYSGAIKICLESYLPHGYDTADISGMSLEDICREYIDAEIPVLIWASMDMRETYQKESSSWIIEDTGERFQWISCEHCLVLTGYDERFYYFNDPLNNKNTAYDRAVSEKRYEELGKQAIAVIHNK